MLKKLFVVTLLTTLGACSGVEVSDYRDMQPTFVPEAFFNGRLTAHGVVKERRGKVIRSFNADIIAYWKDGVGTLEEDFLFDDGEEQRRVWQLTPAGKHRYIATAGDVVGEGTMEVAGNSLFLDYTLRINWRNGTIDLRVDDRMYLVSENVLVNESHMTKFGLHVGSILLTIVRHPDTRHVRSLHSAGGVPFPRVSPP